MYHGSPTRKTELTERLEEILKKDIVNVHVRIQQLHEKDYVNSTGRTPEEAKACGDYRLKEWYYHRPYHYEALRIRYMAEGKKQFEYISTMDLKNPMQLSLRLCQILKKADKTKATDGRQAMQIVYRCVANSLLAVSNYYKNKFPVDSKSK